MATAFQPNAFQNNAFQIVISLVDTHDGFKKKRINLPIYETKKKKKIEKKIEALQIPDLPIEEEKKLDKPFIPLKEWDNSKIEAHAKATKQTIEEVERKIALLQKYEDELNAEEEEFFSLVVMAFSK